MAQPGMEACRRERGRAGQTSAASARPAGRGMGQTGSGAARPSRSISLFRADAEATRCQAVVKMRSHADWHAVLNKVWGGHIGGHKLVISSVDTTSAILNKDEMPSIATFKDRLPGPWSPSCDPIRVWHLEGFTETAPYFRRSWGGFPPN